MMRLEGFHRGEEGGLTFLPCSPPTGPAETRHARCMCPWRRVFFKSFAFFLSSTSLAIDTLLILVILLLYICTFTALGRSLTSNTPSSPIYISTYFLTIDNWTIDYQSPRTLIWQS